MISAATQARTSGFFFSLVVVVVVFLLHSPSSLLTTSAAATSGTPGAPDLSISFPFGPGPDPSLARRARVISMMARSHPSIAEKVAEAAARERGPTYKDPLEDVLFNGAVAEGSYLSLVRTMLAERIARKVEWLDSAVKDDRELLGRMFSYCANMFAKKGSDRGCVAQCHPAVDCRAQAARECEFTKGNYEMHGRCVDRERSFCAKYGAFDGQRFPLYEKNLAHSEKEQAEDVLGYCGDLFQMRGMRLTCLRECTIYMMRMTRPDDYFFWKAKHRIQDDPSQKQPFSVQVGNQCAQEALQLCTHQHPNAYDECFERLRMQCLLRTSAPSWNEIDRAPK
jgi:hypothetical protein